MTGQKNVTSWFLSAWMLLIAFFPAAAQSGEPDDLPRDFQNPPVDCRPHTRWWWMGNALRQQDITFQLAEMHRQGIGGVEQITMGAVYEKGNHPFLSPEYFDLLKFAVREARRLGMEFSLNFGGPGWIWGGDWIPKEERNKNMVASSVLCAGPSLFQDELPLLAELNPRNPSEPLRKIRPEDRVLAVVAGRMEDGRVAESSLTDLTGRVRGRRLEWAVPEGRWRIMAFWLVLNETGGPSVDHFSVPAMEHYCKGLGDRLRAAVGEEFGKTVESMFADSFEVPVFRNGLYWSDSLLGEFRRRQDYDLTLYLPALWWDVGEISPKIRYDVNEFLHRIGMEAFFQTFVGWCRQNGVKARIQPYGFPTDILEGAGMADIPEMEITAGEKDAVPWFDTRIGPRTYTASGARLYGRNIVSVEAYTYLHWEQARDTLEELKIASDIFLRAGANKFYNHGYTATPEPDFAPARRFGAEMLISHPNTWWPYYRNLADYVARSSVLMRQGRPVADVAVYSPLASQWTLDVLNARRWTRDFDWGELGRLLLANGYDFDLINDDVLQNRAALDQGTIRVRDLEYRVLILPKIEALPLRTLQRIEAFVRGGGTAVALERTPASSTGWKGSRERDAEVRRLSAQLFAEPRNANDTAERRYGAGATYQIRKVMDRGNPLDLRRAPLDPFLKTLHRHVAPDLGIDLVGEGWRENPGLLFCHRATKEREIYFVANVQDRAADLRLAFRVTGKAPQEWNPVTGEIRPRHEFAEKEGRTLLPVRLAPYESTFLVFSGSPAGPALRQSDFLEVLTADRQGFTALADRNGVCGFELSSGERKQLIVEGLPARFEISGRWKLELEGRDFPRREKILDRLESWTEDPATRHFSGTGITGIDFELPASYIAGDILLRLDLGAVGDIAEVELNGVPLGVAWMRGQRLEAGRAARAGRNHLAVKVTNTLIHRVSGWKSTPPVPEELVPLLGAGIREDASSSRNIFGFEPLPRSGLLGPVTLIPMKKVRVPW